MLVGSKVSWLSSTPLAHSQSQCRISKEPATEKPLLVFVPGTRRYREGKRRGKGEISPREGLEIGVRSLAPRAGIRAERHQTRCASSPRLSPPVPAGGSWPCRETDVN